MQYLLSLFLFSALSHFVFASTITRVFDDEVKVLDLRNSEGSTSILPSRDGKVHVTADTTGADRACQLDFKHRDGTLLVASHHQSWFHDRKCKVDFIVRAPKQIAMRLKSGAGNIKVQGTEGQISYRLGAGNLNIVGNPTEVVGVSGSGDVAVNFKTAPKEGSVNSKSGSGNIRIHLPKESRISSTLNSTSGDVSSDFAADDRAFFKIEAASGSGDLSLKRSLK